MGKLKVYGTVKIFKTHKRRYTTTVKEHYRRVGKYIWRWKKIKPYKTKKWRKITTKRTKYIEPEIDAPKGTDIRQKVKEEIEKHEWVEYEGTEYENG